jgi:hypothetical protein
MIRTLTSLTFFLSSARVLLVNQPAHAQVDLSAIVVKHLTTSRAFTLRVAEQMPMASRLPSISSTSATARA